MRGTLALVLVLLVACGDGREPPPAKGGVYAVWDTMELDKCASVWLIVRFVDSDAKFVTYPQGTLEMEGIPFDTPTSEYRRTHRLSCFEVTMGRHGLKDEKLAKMAKLVRAIEVEYWLPRRDPAALDLNRRLRELVKTAGSPAEALPKTFALFDQVYDVVER